jgi:hypothetical protein
MRAESATRCQRAALTRSAVVVPWLLLSYRVLASPATKEAKVTAKALVLVLCSALLTACQMTVVAPGNESARPQLGEPMVLAVGESVALRDPVLENTIAVTFNGVRSDSRCPKSTTVDVMCAWSGAVEVEMTAVVNDQTETFPMTGITDYDGVVEGSIESETDTTIWYFAGYHFVLQRVVPYPEEENRPQADDYVATVVVWRMDEPLHTPTGPAASIEPMIDEEGLPVLCASDEMLVKWAAGDPEMDPLQLTPPIGAQFLPDLDSADEVCALVFGEGWRTPHVEELDGIWAEFVPSDVRYWVGNGELDELVER